MTKIETHVKVVKIAQGIMKELVIMIRNVSMKRPLPKRRFVLHQNVVEKHERKNVANPKVVLVTEIAGEKRKKNVLGKNRLLIEAEIIKIKKRK